jgi:hypothetical protein
MNEGQSSQINPRKYQHGRDSEVHSNIFTTSTVAIGGTWKTICGDEQPNKNGLKREHMFKVFSPQPVPSAIPSRMSAKSGAGHWH